MFVSVRVVEAEAMTNIHHTIDYIELNVSDLPATRSFYEAAFGWSSTTTAPSTPASVPPTVRARWVASTPPPRRVPAVRS